MARELVDIEVLIAHETERAVMIKEAEDSEPIWLPKSQVEIHGDVGDTGTITLPEWLAEERGLI